MKVELGDEVKCMVTGLSGIAVAYAKHITGCDRVSVQPSVDKDKKMQDAWWVDVHALKVLKKGKVNIELSENPKERGGPMSKLK